MDYTPQPPRHHPHRPRPLTSLDPSHPPPPELHAPPRHPPNGSLDQHSSSKSRSNGRSPFHPRSGNKPRPRRFSFSDSGTRAYRDGDDLQKAANLLLQWMPSLLPDLCPSCSRHVEERIERLASGDLLSFPGGEAAGMLRNTSTRESIFSSQVSESLSTSADAVLASETGSTLDQGHSKGGSLDGGLQWTNDDGRTRFMAQEEVAESVGQQSAEDADDGLTALSEGLLDFVDLDDIGTSMSGLEISTPQKSQLPREVREKIRLDRVERKKEFVFQEQVNGKSMNIVEGLELHTAVFSAAEQKKLVNYIHELQDRYQGHHPSGSNGEPSSVRRTRVSLKFGSNFTVDEKGSQIVGGKFDEIPSLLQIAIRRLVKWQVVPPSCTPDSCIITIHPEGDYMLPQKNHQHSCLSCILSLSSDCNMVFGLNLKVDRSGEIENGFRIRLPMGAALVLKGKAAEIAKHGVPSVPVKRISVKFQRLARVDAIPGNQGWQGGLSNSIHIKHLENSGEKLISGSPVSSELGQISGSNAVATVLAAKRTSSLNEKQNSAYEPKVFAVSPNMQVVASKQRANLSNERENKLGSDSSVIFNNLGSNSDEGIHLQAASSTPLSWAGLVDSPDMDSSLSRDKEYARFLQVGRKKDFICWERVNGKMTNIVEGLELHTNVFDAAEQNALVNFIHNLQEKGRNQEFCERTYSEPRKWMRGKGRVTIQFGCCYNYAVDKHGNPPGIIRDETVDPIPPLLRNVIKRLVRWQVLPRSCVPDSCIVNLYDVGDCIPPHIDHHDFVRPFCTVSLLSECNIIFGSNLKIIGPGEFQGSLSVPLPVGSILVLNGNGSDVAKHAVPAVPTKRISITFRKMDPSKAPYDFSPDPDMIITEQILYNISPSLRMKDKQSQFEGSPVDSSKESTNSHSSSVTSRRTDVGRGQDLSFILETDFPPLHSSKSVQKHHIQATTTR